MKQYLGVKLVNAEPWFGRDNKLVPENSEFNGTEIKGYKVVYEDGYVSWSPLDIFEKSYREINNLTFGLAIEALKLNRKVSRSGWNDKGMWLELQKPDLHYKMTLPYIYMKTADNNLVPWLASQTDILSEDWTILDK
jgi:hypothetical protein